MAERQARRRGPSFAPGLGSLAALLVVCFSMAHCGGGERKGDAASARRGEGIDPATLPPSLRADYAVFAVRCSKCHSLSRPLDSGIEAERWPYYVARMRRQPSSGIALEDVPRILRFLQYHSLERRRLKGELGAQPLESR